MKFDLRGIINMNKTNIEDMWIPCTERLPESDERYAGKRIINCIITTESGRVTKVQRQKYEDTWCWNRIYGKPKAWMPLPKPYKD